MKHQLPPINGKYYDNYFWIKLETDKKPEKYLRSKEIIPTLIHEYIHFIQNVSTTYGVINIAHTYSGIAHFYNAHNKTFPFTITDHNYVTNKELFSVSEKIVKSSTYSMTFNKNDPLLQLSYRKKIVTVDLISNLKLEEYKIDIQRPKQKTETYYFDVTAIEEGMCRIYEEHLSNTSSNIYQIPYSLPEIMVRIIYPTLLHRTDFIFALCDISLMYTNPPELFIKILKHMKSNSYIPKTIPELYKYCYNNMQIEGDTLINYWNNAFNEAKYNIRNAFNYDTIKFAADWIINTIEFYKNYRLYIPYFLSLPLTFQSNKTLFCICSLMRINISPILINNKNQYSALSKIKMTTEEQTALFHFIEIQCMNEFVFNTDGSCCTFDKICPIFDKCPYALNNPLTKPLIDGQICCFQQNAVSYGLRNVFPTK